MSGSAGAIACSCDDALQGPTAALAPFSQSQLPALFDGPVTLAIRIFNLGARQTEFFARHGERLCFPAH
jgi:hypothetical protein